MQYDMELQLRPGTRHQFPDALLCSHGNKTRGATVDDSFPGDETMKRNYRGPQGPVLHGMPLGQLGIDGINNNALPLTVLAAVTFTPDLPPFDTNPVGHKILRPLIGFRTDTAKGCSHRMRGGELHSGTG